MKRPNVCFIMVCLAVTETIAGQTVHEIGSRPSCGTCTVQLERLLTLNDSEPFWLTGVLSLSRDSKGRYHGTSFPVTPGKIHVLDANGRRIASYGGQGRGPGEGLQTTAPLVFGVNDTAYTYDPGLRRFTVWSPSLEFVRTFNAPPPDGVLVTKNNQLIVASLIPTREHAGWPLHVIDAGSGEVAKSFGADQPALRYDVPELGRRKITPSIGDRFWAAHITRYVLEQWDTNGRKIMEIRRNAEWFPPHVGRAVNGKPQSYIQGIFEDRDGLLWVYIQTPDRNYEANRAKLPDPGDGMGRQVNAMASHTLVDVIIEVIDPRAGVLVATGRFDESLRTNGSNAPLHAYREAADGSPRFDVYRARLVR